MIRILTIFCLLVLQMGIGSPSCWSNSISNIAFDPVWPANLNFGQQVNVSFNYDITLVGGVQIFVRPITSGQLTPDYAASGSAIYYGSGRENTSFTIQSGSSIKVDQIRFQIFSSDQSRLIFEFFIPVDFTFSTWTGIIAYVVPIDSLPISKEEEVSSIKYSILSDGKVEIKYSDGKVIQRWNGGYSIRYPGEEPGTFLFSTQARAVFPPAPPDQAELPWMNEHNNELLEIIKTLVDFDTTSITNYLQFEGPVDIRNQIILREETIKYLIQP